MTTTSPVPWVHGIATGLVAASIGALYTVFARWGIAKGLHGVDLTALRFGVAGLLMLPVLGWLLRRHAPALRAHWQLWLAVALLAGTPFGLLMFGALQFAPASHAAVFPFAAMSVAGMLLSWRVFGDPMPLRKWLGMAVVVAGLIVVSGLDLATLQGRALLGDGMFVLAGVSWAGFGVLLRRHRLDPLLATAVISVSALLSFVPAYLLMGGGARLLEVAPEVLWTEVLVQGAIAGTGTLLSYARMVALLGPARAALFPALAPGLAALLAWPVLGHVPGLTEAIGLLLVVGGLLLAVLPALPSWRPA
jgi:drug/metabolite transporter (DMT)-like permease